MSDRPVRVLIIDDNSALANDAKREINDFFDSAETSMLVEIALDFEEGYALLRQGRFDLVVLDVRRDATAESDEDQSAGPGIYAGIKDVRFVPVIFWTALPEHVRGEEMPPLVSVIAKDETERLPHIIQAVVDSGAMFIMADIEHHVSEILRNHMWSELAPNWAEYLDGTEPVDLAHVLVSRVARILGSDRQQKFTNHPSHRYMYPPAVDQHGPGDLLLNREDETWWMVVTPACDFEQSKAERVSLVAALLLDESEKYQAWIASDDSNSKWEPLRRTIINSSQDRFLYLPAFRRIPDLVVDLQHVRSIPISELGEFEVIAALASPFSEALLVQKSHYSGRIGVPDLESEPIRTRLLVQSRAASKEVEDGTGAL